MEEELPQAELVPYQKPDRVRQWVLRERERQAAKHPILSRVRLGGLGDAFLAVMSWTCLCGALLILAKYISTL